MRGSEKKTIKIENFEISTHINNRKKIIDDNDENWKEICEQERNRNEILRDTVKQDNLVENLQHKLTKLEMMNDKLMRENRNLVNKISENNIK